MKDDIVKANPMDEKLKTIKNMSRFNLETVFWWNANMDLDDTKRLSLEILRRVCARNIKDEAWSWDSVSEAIRHGDCE